jgi:hypothetical protein
MGHLPSLAKSNKKIGLPVSNPGKGTPSRYLNRRNNTQHEEIQDNNKKFNVNVIINIYNVLHICKSSSVINLS